MNLTKIRMILQKKPSFQMLDDHFRGKPGYSEELMAFTSSAISGMYSLVGPLVAIILDKVGYRISCWIGMGGIIICYAATLYLSQHFWAFVLFYGVLNGIGSGLIFMAANTVTALYFKDKKSLGKMNCMPFISFANLKYKLIMKCGIIFC